MFLLTHTFKDPKLAVNQVHYLLAWLENLAQGKSVTSSALHIETEEAMA
jgi:hypothetical protein